LTADRLLFPTGQSAIGTGGSPGRFFTAKGLTNTKAQDKHKHLTFNA
jgi:hypothetical protein